MEENPTGKKFEEFWKQCNITQQHLSMSVSMWNLDNSRSSAYISISLNLYVFILHLISKIDLGMFHK